MHPDTLKWLAEADAFAALCLTRRDALWAAKALKAPAPLPLFGPDGEGGMEPAVTLPQMTLGQEMIEDYLSLRLSLRAHPMELLRPKLPESLPHSRLSQAKGRVSITSLVITRQRPGTAAGVIFLTLEDETGTANVIVWKQVYGAFRKAVIAGRLVCASRGTFSATAPPPTSSPNGSRMSRRCWPPLAARLSFTPTMAARMRSSGL